MPQITILSGRKRRATAVACLMLCTTQIATSFAPRGAAKNLQKRPTSSLLLYLQAEPKARSSSINWPFFNTNATTTVADSAKELDSAVVSTAELLVQDEDEFSDSGGRPAKVLPPSGEMTEIEMATMSAVGLGVAFGVIYFLALSSDDAMQLSRLVEPNNLEEALDSVAENIYAAAMPRSAADVFSVALGEGIAGVIGAGATILISFLLRLREKAVQVQDTVGGVLMEENRRALFSEAVADGDYFLTRAAALPLFEAIGVPPIIASISSVLVASVPYELVKLGSRRKEALMEENAMMEQMLKEEQERLQEKSKGLFRSLTTSASASAQAPVSVDPKALVPVNAQALDWPELFADITKWLEYDVLKTDFSGTFTWDGRPFAGNLEGATFGFLAALSSQLYADLIYRYTEYGTEANREESRNRTLQGWIRLYTRKCLSAAALFGIYETVKGPVSAFLADFLSGGVDSCLGSLDYDLCVETYTLSNPPEASYAAQFRSLVTAIVSLSSRLQYDDSIDKAEFIRSVLVQLYSFFLQIFSFGLFAS